MKAFLARYDITVAYILSGLCDILILIAKPALVPGLLPLLILQALLFIIRKKWNHNYLALQKALYFYLIAFSYITFFLMGAFISGDEVSLVLRIPYYILASLLCLWLLVNRLLMPKERPELEGPKVFKTLWSWVDAILWSLIMVSVVQTFLFQIYVIPSESMVPTYYVQDRPFVLKALSGPTIPLTNLRIPQIYKPKRGDIVVVKNIRYDHSFVAESSRFLKDLIFMSTLSLVNLNVDEKGEAIPDPLVKRLVASGGDRIMMVNDQTYVQSSENGPWKEASWAPYKPVEPNPRLQYEPVTAQARENLTRLDALIAQIDPDTWYETTALRIKDYQTKLSKRPLLSEKPAAVDFQTVRLERLGQSGLSSLISAIVWEFQSGESISSTSRAVDFFLHRTASAGPELYFQQTLKTDLYLKSFILDILDTFIQALDSAVSDETKQSLAQQQSDLILDWQSHVLPYIINYFDFRNLEPFPEQGRLKEDEFFAMGDNRYNSLDSRHYSTTPFEKHLVKNNPYSFAYTGRNNPFIFHSSDILGIPLFRIWPWG